MDVKELLIQIIWSRKGVDVNESTPLYSSGLLDSLEMFDIIMVLERYGFKLNFIEKNIQGRIDELDTINSIANLVKHE